MLTFPSRTPPDEIALYEANGHADGSFSLSRAL
jgi:hypothetical protein